MTVRPHCLRCGSANVIMDEDVLNGRTSVYCYLCGNRQYKGTDYIGFEMREETMRGTCKNCNRSGLHIVSQGLCFVCRKVSTQNPDPGPVRDAALASAAKRAAALPGPHTNKKGPTPGNGRSAARGGKPLPAEPPGDRSVEKKLRQGFQKRQDAIDDRPNPDAEPVTLQVRFAGPDVSLFRSLKEYSARHRRDPADQILCLIDDAVNQPSAGVRP